MNRLILAGLLFVSTIASATDSEFALSGGFRTNNMNGDTGVSITGQNGFQLGGLAWFHFADPLSLRVGFLYSQRYVQVDSTPVTDVKFTYLDIPLTVQYRFGDFGGVFFGPVLMMNQSKECSRAGSTGNVCTNVAGSMTPMSLGVSFKFAPQMGGELAYEFMNGKVADGLYDLRSLGANFVYYFD